MDVESLAKQLILKGMTEEQQSAVLESIKSTMLQARAVQKQRVGENVQVVVQALKKIEADLRGEYSDVADKLAKRIAAIKDGKDGQNGINGKDGRDGRPGRDGSTGPKGANGLDGRNGIDGKDGVSVTNAYIDFDGSLVINLSDGQVLNVGEVVSQDLADKIQVISTMSTNGAVGISDEGASISTGVKNINFVGATVTATASGDDVTVNVSAGTGSVTSVAATAGTGISVTGSPITTSGTLNITNTAPDQVVSLTGSGATTVTGTYPNFTIASTGGGTVTSVAATAGTGISITGSPITTSGTIDIVNTAPDQVVVLTASTGISTSGTYPNFTITNTAPDQTVSLTGAGTTSISGTYPNFTITSADSTVGTVTSVSGTGTVSGISLSGTVTSSGNLTLGGTLDLSSPPTIGNTSPNTGRFTTLTVDDNTTLGSSNSDDVIFNARIASEFSPATDNTYDLGRVGHEWRDLYIDGTANIDSLVADTADINAGSIDGTTIGAASAAAATVTTLNTSGEVIFNDAGANVDFRVEGDTDANLLFVDASTDRIGVGTATPAQKLDVSGIVQATRFSGTNGSTALVNTAAGDNRPLFIQNSNAGGLPNGSLYIDNTNNPNNTSYVLLQAVAGGSVKFLVYGNGTTQNGTGVYGTVSDERIKKDIVDTSPKLDKLLQVRVVNYTRTDDPTESRQLGVIAQELEEIFPGLVDVVAEKDVDGNVTCPDRKSVKYSIFVPMLIKAIQEQQAIIAQLQADVAALKAQNPVQPDPNAG